jgi:hypothetical protein
LEPSPFVNCEAAACSDWAAVEMGGDTVDGSGLATGSDPARPVPDVTCWIVVLTPDAADWTLPAAGLTTLEAVLAVLETVPATFETALAAVLETVPGTFETAPASLETVLPATFDTVRVTPESLAPLPATVPLTVLDST